MQLVEVVALGLEPPQARFAGCAQVRGARVLPPLAWPGANQAALGGDQQAPRVGVQRFGDQPLADHRPVGIGGIDEVDAEFDHATQHRTRLPLVLRFAPDAFAGDAHRAEAHARHLQVSADPERAGRGGRGFRVDDFLRSICRGDRGRLRGEHGERRRCLADEAATVRAGQLHGVISSSVTGCWVATTMPVRAGARAGRGTHRASCGPGSCSRPCRRGRSGRWSAGSRSTPGRASRRAHPCRVRSAARCETPGNT